MNLKTEQEFIRLTSLEPLVLSVSALCDFLWDDFIRDAQPTVKYLTDYCNVSQLSRFGKELFDFLYNGGAVTPLVNLDDIESYFRAKQDGQVAPYPSGYKPENSFWFGLFNDICNAPMWPNIMSMSCGNQFTAGNNSVNIINKLSELIEQQVHQDQVFAHALAEGNQQLQDLRDKFLEAREEGDEAKAAGLRRLGKELGKQLEKTFSEVRQLIQPAVATAVDRTFEEASELNEDMETMAGTHKGIGAHSNDLEAKRQLAKSLRRNKKLKQLVNRIGGLRKAWNNRKRAKQTQSNYSDIVGAKFSDDIKNIFPTELALAGTHVGQTLFALKYSQKTLLTKDYEAKVKEISYGPIIMYVDISGSMSGEAELWSKAVACVVAEECLEQKRELQIHLFDTVIQESIVLKGDRRSNEDLLNFVMTWATKGGTSFSAVISHVLNQTSLSPKTDVLLITDGEADIPELFIRRLETFKDKMNMQWNTFCIGKKANVLHKFSDEVFLVDVDNDPDSVELFQKSIR